jgi:hypothetical protein
MNELSFIYGGLTHKKRQVKLFVEGGKPEDQRSEIRGLR